MTDQTNAPTQRVFVIGATKIVEDDSTRGMTAEQVRNLLKTAYPEVAHATIRERDTAEGQHVVEFMVSPGRKG